MFSGEWETASAKIVAKKFKESGERSGVWEYVADVTLASGQVFRTTLKQPPFMSHVVRLAEGAVLGVLADARRQRAKFDRADPRISGKGGQGDPYRSDKAKFDAALREPPGGGRDGGRAGTA
jgi:hypothetical protein